jgi:ubiquinol-cytochrome c reductase cytochrome b subunit
MVTRLNKNPIIAFGSTHAVDYPTPINLSYFWGFGFLAITMLVIQILTGVFLAMH